MAYLTKTAIVAGLFVPSVAFAQLSAGDVAGTEEAQILVFLEAQGYTIMEVETEDNELGIEAMLDGLMFEIEVDLTTGEIAEVKAEDDNEDDEDEGDEDGDDEDGEGEEES